MSSSTSVKCVTLPAGEVLAGDLYELVKIEDDAGVGKVIKTTAATDTAVGVVYESMDDQSGADGEPVTVALIAAGGIGEVKAGGAITAGDIVVPDAAVAGRAASGGADVAALAADVVGIGIALETAVDGDVFKVLFQQVTSALSA